MPWGPTKWMGSKLTSDGDAGREVGWLQKFREKKNGSIESICCSLPAVSTFSPPPCCCTELGLSSSPGSLSPPGKCSQPSSQPSFHFTVPCRGAQHLTKAMKPLTLFPHPSLLAPSLSCVSHLLHLDENYGASSGVVIWLKELGIHQCKGMQEQNPVSSPSIWGAFTPHTQM